MNIQEILAFIILFAAVFFLVKKFFWKKSSKNCGTDDGCGACH
jgi:F0F1-type ATP synthase membrane subunit b/b'